MVSFGLGLDIATSLIGAVVDLTGKKKAASAAAGQSEFQAQVADNNKIIADKAAVEARARGEKSALDAISRSREQERRQRQQTTQLIGTQRATLASHGVLVDVGTALDIVSDSENIGELDVLNIREQANRDAFDIRQSAEDRARALEQQGKGFESESVLNLLAADDAREAGRFNVLSTLVSGTASVASKWYGLK